MKLGDLEFDLNDPDLFLRGFPHELFRRIRAEQPVFFHDEPEGPGFWVVSKYHDVIEVSRNPQVFSSSFGTNIRDTPPQGLPMLRLLMLNMDPPQHVKFRRIVQRGFTPRVIGQLGGHIRELARAIVDGVAKAGACEFVTQVAAELPLQVIVELLGVPMQDRSKVFEWSNRLIGFDDPDFRTSPEQGAAAAAQMFAYANQLALERKAKPQEDLITQLLLGEVDGENLTEMELDSFFLLLAVAGNETTRNQISLGMLELIQHPEQRKLLLDQPERIDAAISEMLRFNSPVMYFRRTALQDAEIRGHAIREGQKVVMYYPSANRDEEVFERADSFDIGRESNPHLALGIGEHYCLGANLAHLELKLVFQELLGRLPDIELAGPVRRLRSNFVQGIKHMPVRFTPES
jgi:cholest-4-en-3-one 26-monooxygenase